MRGNYGQKTYQNSKDRIGRSRVFVSGKINYSFNPIINLSEKFWGNIFIFFCLLLFIWLVFFSNFFKIKEVFIEGAELASTEDIKSKAPIGENIFLFDISSVKNSIKNSSPIISDVEIYRGIPNALKIVILEKKPSIVWQTQDKFFLVDESGVVVKEINQAEYPELIHISDQKDLEVKTGQKIISSQFVVFAKTVNDKFFTQTNIKINGWKISETTFDLYVYIEAGFFVKFDTTRPAETQIENIQKILVAYRPNIKEYIDVRINGWVYYK